MHGSREGLANQPPGCGGFEAVWIRLWPSFQGWKNIFGCLGGGGATVRASPFNHVKWNGATRAHLPGLRDSWGWTVKASKMRMSWCRHWILGVGLRFPKVDAG